MTTPNNEQVNKLMEKIARATLIFFPDIVAADDALFVELARDSYGLSPQEIAEARERGLPFFSRHRRRFVSVVPEVFPDRE